MLSRLRWGRKWVRTKVRSSRAKLVTRHNVQTMARSSSVAFQDNLCGRPRGPDSLPHRACATCGWSRWRRHNAGRGDACALTGASDLGPRDGRGAGVRMDLQHGSDLPLAGLDQTVEQVAVGGNSTPHRIPTMLRDLTRGHPAKGCRFRQCWGGPAELHQAGSGVRHVQGRLIEPLVSPCHLHALSAPLSVIMRWCRQSADRSERSPYPLLLLHCR